MDRRPGPDVDGLLFADEAVRRTVAAADSTLVVTTRRLLCFTPSADGRRYDAVYRDNVDGVDAVRRGTIPAAAILPRAALWGAILLGGGWAIREIVLPGLDLSVPATGTAPIGPIVGVVGALESGLAVLSLLLILAGALALIGAAVLGIVAVATRRTALVIERAGEGPIVCLAPAGAARRAADELRAALAADDAATSVNRPAGAPSERAPASDRETVD